MTRSKRENGHGTVYKTGDSYLARFPLCKDSENRVKFKSKRFPTREKAEEWLQSFATHYGYLLTDSSGTGDLLVGRYMESWLASNKVNELKPRSYDRLEQTLKGQVIPAIGRIRMAELMPMDIQAMIQGLKNKGYSYSTIKKAYNCCNDCFSTAVAQHYMNFNPCTHVTIPRRSQFAEQEIRYYSSEEQISLINAACKRYSNDRLVYRLGPVVPLLIHTGLRVSEALGLRWTDVDFSSRRINIHATRVPVKNRDPRIERKNVYIVQDGLSGTKSRSGCRTIPLDATALAALKTLYQATGNYEFVLTNEAGKPSDGRIIDRTCRKVMSAAGLPENKIWGLHAFRHTFASNMLRAGIDFKTLSVIMGHKDVSTTMDIYVHIAPDQTEEAVAKMEEFMRKSSDAEGIEDVIYKAPVVIPAYNDRVK